MHTSNLFIFSSCFHSGNRIPDLISKSMLIISQRLNTSLFEWLTVSIVEENSFLFFMDIKRFYRFSTILVYKEYFRRKHFMTYLLLNKIFRSFISTLFLSIIIIWKHMRNAKRRRICLIRNVLFNDFFQSWMNCHNSKDRWIFFFLE